MSKASTSLLHVIRAITGAYQVDGRSDAQLLAQYAATRNETAFATLMMRHGPLVCGICNRVLGNAEDAEEACQTIFLALAQNAAKVHVAESLGGWLQVVARRTALNIRKKLRSQKKLQEQLKAMAPAEVVKEELSDDVDEVYGLLHDELMKMPEKLRTALVLHYWEGRTQAEIAGIIGVKRAAVCHRLTRGKAMLQKRLAKRGVALGATALSVLLAEAVSPAALPPSLVAKTLKTAADIQTGKPSGALGELVKEVFKHTLIASPWLKFGWMIAALCVSGLIAGAGGIAVWKAGFFRDKAAETFVAAQDARQQGDQEKVKPVRLDAYGDPLPEHALARMGTLRLKQQPDGFHPAVLFTSDGTRMITQAGASGNKIRVWDVGSGRKMLELSEKGEAVGCLLAVSPDGRRLAAANGLNTVRVWDLASGKLLQTYEESKSRQAGAEVRTRSLRAMHFFNNGKILAVEEELRHCGKGETTHLERLALHAREVTTGKVVPLSGWSKNTIRATAISQDGKLFAAASLLREVRPGFGEQDGYEIDIWRTTDAGEKIRQIKIKAERDVRHAPDAHNAYFETGLPSLAFSPDGRTLAGLKEKLIANNIIERSIYLWDVATGRKINRLLGGAGCLVVAFSPDGKKVVGGGNHLWDLATGDKIRSFNWGRLSAIAYSPTGEEIAALEENGAIRLWKAASGEEIGLRVGLRAGIQTIAYSANGKTLVSESDCSENMFRWWDVGTGKEIRQRKVGLSPAKVVFSVDGKTRLALEDRPDRPLMPLQGMAFSDLNTGRELCFIKEPHYPSSFPALSADGKKLAMLCDYGKTAKIWKVDTGELACGLLIDAKGLPSPYRVAFSPDGRILAASSADATVKFWELATGKIIGSLGGKSQMPGGKWNEATQRREPVPRPAKILCPVLFSPDGRTLLTTAGREQGWCGTFELRDVADGRIIYRLPIPEYSMTEPSPSAFSPCGRILAIVGIALSVGPGLSREWQNIVHLMDTASGREICSLTGHEDRVCALVFSPDGRTLASCSKDGTCLIWDVAGLETRNDWFARSPRQAEKELSKTELESAWKDLELEPAKGYRAVWELVAAPRQAVRLLRARVRPASALAETREIERWIAELGDSRFSVRQKAQRSIECMGEAVIAPLQRALQGPLPLEVRKRVQDLLTKAGLPLRRLRAVQVLEYIGTPEAQEMLQALAQGVSEARVTQEAQASLARLAKRPADKL